MKPGGILLIIETVEDVPDILITQSFMMTEPKDQRKATNTMFLNRKQWLEILEENGFCNSEEFPGYGEYLEVLGQKLFIVQRSNACYAIGNYKKVSLLNKNTIYLCMEHIMQHGVGKNISYRFFMLMDIMFML